VNKVSDISLNRELFDDLTSTAGTIRFQIIGIMALYDELQKCLGRDRPRFTLRSPAGTYWRILVIKLVLRGIFTPATFGYKRCHCVYLFGKELHVARY
jgi:hypothetical protein